MVMICEIIKPDECYLLEKDEDGITYAGNNKGRVFVAKAKYQD